MVEGRSPGRPRSEQSRQAILIATLELVTEVGYAGLTIEGIAARAGVGKQTIYRWWGTKADVLLEAGAAKADIQIPTDDRGSYQADLHAFLEASYRVGNRPEYTALLQALMAEAQINTDFGQRFRESFLERRRSALAVITDRARERGDLPERPSPGTVADVVFGTIWYRVLATHAVLDAELMQDLLAVLCGDSK